MITDFYEKAVIVSNEGEVQIRSGNNSLAMNASECSCLILWSDSFRKDYFCVKPALMEPSSFGDYEGGGRFLTIGEELKMSLKLELIF